ncbi:type IV secretion system protein VirB10 [Massilia pseudoviolaceinigra]|uniref:type IV secretion system protein VirB10 n=1 Tax=Massilia pseudoviolaceinigra TaxID=3057165 RepID=UPI0027967F6B|nr:type IV secretion system protein VirB10 [Massilia sp. CCM 9206]MDQ1922675.1 type IV secretion system protein VirB10 [Massilia sp. CCM 9206]
MADNDVNSSAPTPPEARGIVSVNSRGGSSSGIMGKVIFVMVLLAVLVIGSLIAFNNYRASQKAAAGLADQNSKNENKPALVGQRRKFDTDPPLLPSGADTPKKATASLPIIPGQGCADGSPGQILLGPDGQPMMAPAGQPMRVCANGQVVVPGLAARPGEAPIGVVGQGGGQVGGPPPPSRYAGDVIVPASSGGGGGALSPNDPNNPFVKAVLANMQGGGAQGGMGPARSMGPPLSPPAQEPVGSPPSQQGAIGNLLQSSQTPTISAGMLGDRNMILPKGRTIDCNLSTRVISEVSGMATCVFSSNVYSDNGRVVLAERGSEATGEYTAQMTQGQRRLFILWTRIKTPRGVTVNINSPASDSLGTSGVDGFIEHRWMERIGAAFLLSLVQDAISYQTAKATSGGAAGGVTVMEKSTQTGKSIAERVLESTINIKPTLYKNQGDRASIFVARDVDFGSVYALRAN